MRSVQVVEKKATGNSKKAKIFAFALCAILFALCSSARAQQPKKVPRIGYLSSLSHSSDPRAEPLQRALRELGYIEGQNLVTEYRYAEAKFDRIRELAADLVRLKVDIIVVASGDQLIQAAKNATTTIPIVFVTGADPIQAGLIASLITATLPQMQEWFDRDGQVMSVAAAAEKEGLDEVFREAGPGIWRAVYAFCGGRRAQILLRREARFDLARFDPVSPDLDLLVGAA